MSISTIQNFYKETITRAVTLTGATNIYVSALPTPDEGYVVISPSSSSLREIVYYTAKGTDSNGTYLTVTLANRGLGGTTAQTHAIGEPVRMNVTAEHIKEISDALDQIVAAGAQDASTITKGIVKLNVAPAIATEPIAVGANVLTNISYGTSSVGKVPQLDSNGKIDDSMVNLQIDIDSGYIVSDNLLHSNDVTVVAAGTSYTKAKETRIDSFVNTIRIKCDLSSSNTHTKYLKVYVNGVALNDSEVSGSLSFSLSYDLTTPLKPDDLIQIYVRTQTGTAADVDVSNFRLYGTLDNKRIYQIGGYQLASPLEVKVPSTVVFTATNIL